MDPVRPGDIGCVDRRINLLHNANDGEAYASGLERPTCGSAKCGATTRSLSVANCQKLRALLASFRPTRCDCDAAHPGIVDQSAACASAQDIEPLRSVPVIGDVKL